jgi:drug/metabolite transporter (DMT)-like permease
MMVKLFILLVTLNTVASHMLLKRAIQDFGQPSSLAEMPGFIASAAVSPWVWCSLVLQVIGYVGWMVVITHEKLGVATASVGASYYLLTATAAWLVFGERLGAMQWFGIFLITIGLVCVSVVTNK